MLSWREPFELLNDFMECLPLDLLRVLVLSLDPGGLMAWYSGESCGLAIYGDGALFSICGLTD